MTDITTIRQSLTTDLERVNALIAEKLNSTNPLINEVIGRYLSHKGKQLRPMIVLLTAKMLGADMSLSVTASAASVEMLHNASLIHDDVIDQSAIRHNAATINAVWDNHIAVLLGDYFVSSALQLVISTADLRAVNALASLGRLLSVGEMDQIYNAANCLKSEEAYFQVISHKTASLFVACVEMGAFAARADETTIGVLRQFAMIFGQCFQIKDDIFDYFKSDVLGKPTGNDLREGKVTLPLLHALSMESDPRCGEMADMLSHGSLTDDEIARLIDFAIDLGGIDYAEATLRRLRDEAAGILAKLPPSVDTAPLLTLLDYIIDRDK